MKVVQINATCGVGSTGKICVGISELMSAHGIENFILYSSRTSGYPLGIRCSNDRYVRMQALKSKILGNYGFNSKRATQKIIRELERIEPDLVHLHNIHGHDCDLESLFSYFQRKKTKLVWTFHDCWTYTAYCPHFTMMKCEKWRTQCSDCIQYRDYSWFFDRSEELFEKKKRLFSGLDLTIVTPSKWLADLVKESFLKEYPVKVINNGIDLEVFRPTPSDFRERSGLVGKKLILGVAFGWGERKGLDVFVKLACRLPEAYRIILVGTDEKVDRELPESITSIHRTQNQRELAEIYSAADLFVNPTREENYPTVNMESLACGTPVLTFRTGGSPEVVDSSCGAVVDCDDVESLEKEIIRICSDTPFTEHDCLKRAASFEQKERFREYLNLYDEIIIEIGKIECNCY